MSSINKDENNVLSKQQQQQNWEWNDLLTMFTPALSHYTKGNTGGLWEKKA